jgi:uncharacterized protein (TIGR03437 family)
VHRNAFRKRKDAVFHRIYQIFPPTADLLASRLMYTIPIGGIMKLPGFALAAACICAAHAFAQMPTVTKLANIYSWTPAGLPNYGTARGSIFAIFGTNLSSATLPLQPPPLQTSLSGVSLSVTVNGTTTQPLLYYLSPTQINAVLPSSTPVGAGTLTVSNGAGTSAGFPIQVVESAFGLLTFNYGAGTLAGFDANNNYAYLGYSAAANPGDILELWGTGLGPVENDAVGGPVSDAAEVDIGGIPANVLYRGRSSYVGLDQINVQVPAGVSGCNVSVVVVTGSYVSNFATIPIASTGRTCADATNPLPASILADVAQSGEFSGGLILLITNTLPVPGGGEPTAGSSYASALFTRQSASQLNPATYPSATGQNISAGSCIVSPSNTTSPTTPSGGVGILNAGPNVNVDGPFGDIAMPYDSEFGTPGFYAIPDGTAFLASPGDTVGFDNGGGGPDVGSFTTQAQMPVPTIWTNAANITSVTRSAGLTVTWTPGTPGTYLSIGGISGGVAGSTAAAQVVIAAFGCLAPAEAGQFTVPPAVLMSLPPTSEFTISASGGLSLYNAGTPVIFSAPNLDYGIVLTLLSQDITVVYQ